MSLIERISVDPEIMGGEPCIRRTRLPVIVILTHLVWGDTVDDILAGWPYLEKEDVLACVEWVAQ